MNMEHGGKRSLHRKLAHLLDLFRLLCLPSHAGKPWPQCTRLVYLLHEGRRYGQPVLRGLLEVIRKHIL